MYLRVRNSAVSNVVAVLLVIAVLGSVVVGIYGFTRTPAVTTSYVTDSSSISTSGTTVSTATLTGKENTLPQTSPPNCTNAPPGATWPQFQCLPSFTQTIAIGATGWCDAGDNCFISSPSEITLTASNGSSVLSITVKITTWNTSALVSLANVTMQKPSSTGFLNLPMLQPGSPTKTYYVPQYTQANATFPFILNFSALKTGGANQIDFTFNVVNALNQTSLGGADMMVYRE